MFRAPTVELRRTSTGCGETSQLADEYKDMTMLKAIRFGVGATLLAAAQLATAASAEVQLSNFTISVSGGEWWYWLPVNESWLAPTAGTSAALLNPAVSDGSIAWHGNALSTSVADGDSFATATLGAATSWDLNGISASAQVVANGGQAGWAFANVFDGQIMVGGHATITISATVSSISASGASSQANAYIELCSTDFTTDTCDFANYAEAFVDGSSGAYSGPSIITASWTNPGETTWAKMHIGATASADSVTAVPEPGTWGLMLAGLAGIGVLRSRRRGSAA
jgi:hypothetical protein